MAKKLFAAPAEWLLITSVPRLLAKSHFEPVLASYRDCTNSQRPPFLTHNSLAPLLAQVAEFSRFLSTAG